MAVVQGSVLVGDRLLEMLHAYGGHAERVEDPRELPGAAERALERVRAGQWAFLDVVTSGEGTRLPR